MTTRDERYDGRHRARAPWGVLGTTLGLIAIILALILNSCSATSTPTATCTPIPGPVGSVGRTGIPGLGAYDVWLELGHTGTEQDFLDSLVGDPGKNGYSGTDGFTPAAGLDGDHGHSAYQLWLDAGHTGSEQDFLDSLRGAAGSDGIVGQTGATGAQGLSAYELWVLEGGIGDEAAFLADLEGNVGPQGIQGLEGLKGDKGDTGTCTPGDAGAAGAKGDTGATGPAGEIGPIGPQGEPGPIGPVGPEGPKGDIGAMGPAGTSGLGDSGSFWDTTLQGYDGLVSTAVDSAHPLYLSEADSANNVGITIERCAGDEAKPGGYPVTPKSCITFTHPGVYNIAFSAQLLRTQGGGASVVSIWLRADGANVAQSNTDVTLQSNSQKLVAAWNFFAPVSCGAGDCTQYQLMWSASEAYSNIWYETAQSSPTRPATPSLIVTVNQVK